MRLRRREIADLSARSERYIGTAGGGMDQAIAMLASPGKSCRSFLIMVVINWHANNDLLDE